MAILIFHSIQLACLYAFNSVEASILIIVMDPHFVLLSTISSSVIFLQGTTEPSDENKKIWMYKPKEYIYLQQKIVRYFCLKSFLQGLHIVFFFFLLLHLRS